jgi:hypothetical protein
LPFCYTSVLQALTNLLLLLLLLLQLLQAYTLHTLRQRDDVQVVGLLTTFNGQAERVAMHAVRLQLLRMQAAAVGLPVHEVRQQWDCQCMRCGSSGTASA